MNNRTKLSEEQLKYASILQIVSLAGLALLLIGFSIYISGLLPTIIPINKISQYWALGGHDFLEKTGLPTGWRWINLLNRGDMVSFLTIILLATATPICLITVLSTFLRNKDVYYVVLIIAQVLVLLLAASGLLTGRG